eukprot:362845_1
MKLQYGIFGKFIESSIGLDDSHSDIDNDNDDDDEQLEEHIMAKLYSFNDTKSMNKLFLQFLNELKSNQIILKQNEQLVPYSWYILTGGDTLDDDDTYYQGKQRWGTILTTRVKALELSSIKHT